jgi:hypothetical protein
MSFGSAKAEGGWRSEKKYSESDFSGSAGGPFLSPDPPAQVRTRSAWVGSGN